MTVAADERTAAVGNGLIAVRSARTVERVQGRSICLSVFIEIQRRRRAHQIDYNVVQIINDDDRFACRVGIFNGFFTFVAERNVGQ